VKATRFANSEAGQPPARKKPRKTPSTGFLNGRFFEIPLIFTVPEKYFEPRRVLLIPRNPLNVNVLR